MRVGSLTELALDSLENFSCTSTAPRNCYSPDIGPGGKVLPSRVLDGRAVLKDRDRSDSVETGTFSLNQLYVASAHMGDQ